MQTLKNATCARRLNIHDRCNKCTFKATVKKTNMVEFLELLKMH